MERADLGRAGYPRLVVHSAVRRLVRLAVFLHGSRHAAADGGADRGSFRKLGRDSVELDPHAGSKRDEPASERFVYVGRLLFRGRNLGTRRLFAAW